MSSFRFNWMGACGCLLISAAIGGLFLTWNDHRILQKSSIAGTASRKIDRALNRSSSSSSSPEVRRRPPRQMPESGSLNSACIKLRELLRSEDFSGIHDELEALASSHQLVDVREILADWCRTGSVELAQWSLELSHESDPALNLTLHVEALSNPSEIIRDIAASELEDKSGFHFTNTVQARSWLADRTSH